MQGKFSDLPILALNAAIPSGTIGSCTNTSLSALSNNQNVSVSVALLFARFGSVTPLGALTFAVSAIEPVADVLIVPVAL